MISEIESLNLSWTENPKIIETRNGPRRLRSAPLDGCREFWKIYKSEKEELNAFGFSPTRRFSGEWILNQWIPLEGFPKIEAKKPVDFIDEIDDSKIEIAGLLPWQKKTVARLIYSLENFGAALDASDVGTGKTYSALATAKIMGLDPVVICPISVIPGWQKAAAHFGISISALNYEKLRTGKTDFGSWSQDKKSFNFFNVSQKTLLIFDEAHRCKSQTSQNSKMLLAASRQKIKTLCLSATAFIDPTEMKSIGELLGLFGRNEFYRWAMKNGCETGRWGGLDFVGGKNALRKIHAEIFPKKGARIRVADLGDAFPENQITTDSVYVSESGARKIDAALEAAREVIERVQLKQARDGDNILTAILRARQISEAEKVPAAVDLISDAIEQGKSVAVFVNFSETIHALQKSLDSLSISLIHGGQTADEREKAIDDFQTNKTKIIIANIQAGGVGVSLHDLTGESPRLSIIFPSYSAILMRQALGRIHRAGGKSKAIQKIIFAANTIEEKICEAVEEKLKNLDALNDGDLI